MSPTPEARRQRRNIALLSVAALVMSLIANAFVGVLLIFTRASTEEYARCSAEWQQQFTVGYLARSDAAAEVSEAMDEVVTAVAAEDAAAFNVAVRKYVTLREKQNAERRKNPLPPLPKTLCGGAP